MRIKILLLSGIFIATQNMYALNPASRFNENTYLYMEIAPANLVIPQLRNIFFSMMNKKKAAEEWKSLEEYFTEDYGLNFLSLDETSSKGLDNRSPIGIGINYVQYKTKEAGTDKTFLKSLIAMILPASDPQAAYALFRNFYSQKVKSQELNNGKKNIFKEIQSGTLFFFNDTARGDQIYVYRGEDSLILCNNPDELKKYYGKPEKPLNVNPDYISNKRNIESKIFSKENIGFFIINQKIAISDIRVNPRLLFDNLIMDTFLVKETSTHANYISGTVNVSDSGLKLDIDYILPKEYLNPKASLLGNAFNSTEEIMFPDNLSAHPIGYLKWGNNFSTEAPDGKQYKLFNKSFITKFFKKYTGLEIDPPESLTNLVKDNLSFYILDIPIVKDVNNYYLWKGYLSFNYNQEYMKDFFEYMKLLMAKAEASKDIKITSRQTGEKFLWEYNIIKHFKKYDRNTGEILIEDKELKTYIYTDARNIIFTHDPEIMSMKFPVSQLPIYKRKNWTDLQGKQIFFALLDMQQVLRYVSKNSFAFSIDEYFTWFEKVKNIAFSINVDKNIIRKELFVRLKE